MSMNIGFEAVREVQVIKTGQLSVQTEEATVWQTPTAVTYAILDAEDQVQAYCDWVLSNSEDQTYPVFAEDDLWGEREPIGEQTFNQGRDHVEWFQEWVKTRVDEGYDIRAYMM